GRLLRSIPGQGLVTGELPERESRQTASPHTGLAAAFRRLASNRNRYSSAFTPGTPGVFWLPVLRATTFPTLRLWIQASGKGGYGLCSKESTGFLNNRNPAALLRRRIRIFRCDRYGVALGSVGARLRHLNR